MKTNISQFKIRPVSRWSLVLLLLVCVGAGFARVGLSSGEINVSDRSCAANHFRHPIGKPCLIIRIQMPKQAERDSCLVADHFTVGIALLIYYVILAIVRAERNPEKVIHVKPGKVILATRWSDLAARFLCQKGSLLNTAFRLKAVRKREKAENGKRDSPAFYYRHHCAGQHHPPVRAKLRLSVLRHLSGSVQPLAVSLASADSAS